MIEKKLSSFNFRKASRQRDEVPGQVNAISGSNKKPRRTLNTSVDSSDNTSDEETDEEQEEEQEEGGQEEERKVDDEPADVPAVCDLPKGSDSAALGSGAPDQGSQPSTTTTASGHGKKQKKEASERKPVVHIPVNRTPEIQVIASYLISPPTLILLVLRLVYFMITRYIPWGCWCPGSLHGQVIVAMVIRICISEMWGMVTVRCLYSRIKSKQLQTAIQNECGRKFCLVCWFDGLLLAKDFNVGIYVSCTICLQLVKISLVCWWVCLFIYMYVHF